MRAYRPETPRTIAERWLLRLVFSLLLCVLALIAFFVFWRIRLSKNISRTLSSFHTAGYPTNLAQLEQQYYPKIPSNENAAPFFQSAFVLLHVTDQDKDLVPDLPDYQSKESADFFAPEKSQLYARLLADNRNAIEILLQSPPATNCRYPVYLDIGVETPLSHLRPLRESAQLLALDAVLQAKGGDLSAVTNNFSAIFRLCHSLDREPFLISQLARLGVGSLAVASLGHILNAGQLTDAQLVYLFHEFQDLEKSPGLEHALVTELCTGLDAFRLAGFTGALPATNTSGAYAFIRLTGLFERDYSFFLQTMAEYLRLESTPFPAKIDSELALDRQTRQECSNHHHPISGIMLPSLGSVAARECGADARLKIIQAVLAIERFRLAHQNRLPDKLDDLVPAFLSTVPTDPFDLKPIRYKKFAKGYMVYSVGEDRKDDGGVYTQPAQRLKPGAPADITFVVER
jgi:hypothetical protein